MTRHPTLTTLCEVSDIAQLLGLPFPRALALYRELERPEPLPALTRRHEGTIGALEIVL